jgi:hypothetical protein
MAEAPACAFAYLPAHPRTHSTEIGRLFSEAWTEICPALQPTTLTSEGAHAELAGECQPFNLPLRYDAKANEEAKAEASKFFAEVFKQ